MLYRLHIQDTGVSKASNFSSVLPFLSPFEFTKLEVVLSLILTDVAFLRGRIELPQSSSQRCYLNKSFNTKLFLGMYGNNKEKKKLINSFKKVGFSCIMPKNYTRSYSVL